MPGQLRIRRTPPTFEVLEAPDEIEISLALIQSCDTEVLIIGTDTLYIGGGHVADRVEYQVTGWNAEGKCLTARKIQ